MGNAKNIDIGACNVKFNSVDLGYTQGGVKVSLEMDTSEVEVDQRALPVDEVVSKYVITVTAPLAEWLVSNLRLAFPFSTVTDIRSKLDTAFSVANAELTFTSKLIGAQGDQYSVTLVDPGEDTSECSVVVNGKDIIVTLSYDTDAIDATAAEVKAAIEANPAAAELIEVAYQADNDGSGIVAALAKTNLSGGVANLRIGDPSGQSLYNSACELVLHPSDLDSSDTSEDFVFFKAAATGGGEITYDKENAKIIEVTFKVYYDSAEDAIAQFGNSVA